MSRVIDGAIEVIVVIVGAAEIGNVNSEVGTEIGAAIVIETDVIEIEIIEPVSVDLTEGIGAMTLIGLAVLIVIAILVRDGAAVVVIGPVRVIMTCHSGRPIARTIAVIDLIVSRRTTAMTEINRYRIACVIWLATITMAGLAVMEVILIGAVRVERFRNGVMFRDNKDRRTLVVDLVEISIQ